MAVARAGAPLGTAWLLVALGRYRAMLLVLAGSGALALLAFALAGRPESKAPALSRKCGFDTFLDPRGGRAPHGGVIGALNSA